MAIILIIRVKYTSWNVAELITTKETETSYDAHYDNSCEFWDRFC